MYTRLVIPIFILFSLLSCKKTVTNKVLEWKKENVNLSNLRTDSYAFYKDASSELFALSSDAKILYTYNISTGKLDSVVINNPNTEISFLICDQSSTALYGKTGYGKDKIYKFNYSLKTWEPLTNGAKDWETFGASVYYNGVNKKIGLFGGYGFFAVKNWIYEISPLSGQSWTEVYKNQDNSGTQGIAKASAKRLTYDKSRQKMYLLGGQGNYSGAQSEKSCNASSAPWATDIGVYCWLRDLWEYDFTTQTFKNIIPASTTDIPFDGPIAYDGTQNRILLMGGFTPPAKWDANYWKTNTFSIDLFEYSLSKKDGFKKMTVVTTALPNTTYANIGDSRLFFDQSLNKLIWINKMGIYTLTL